LVHLQVDHFACLLVVTEEGLEDFFGIVGISITSLQFALSVQTLSKCLIAVFVEEGAFDGVAQNFEGLGQLIELVGSYLWMLFGCFGVVAECEFFIVLCDLMGRCFGGEFECFVVVADHLSLQFIL